MMELIQNEEISKDFEACWTLAASYIQRLGENTIKWFKGNLYRPIYEHFSFRMGNHLFFVRLEDAEGRLSVPGSQNGLFEIARGCNGHPLLMPMKNIGGIWLPIVPGWGLLDARTKLSVNPTKLMDSERIYMSDWELQDMAVNSVIMNLNKGRIINFTNHPDISPSIWLEGESGYEWIIVRFQEAMGKGWKLPINFREIYASAFLRGSGNGYFAKVSFQGNGQTKDTFVDNRQLYRGERIMVNILPLAQLFHNRVSYKVLER